MAPDTDRLMPAMPENAARTAPRLRRRLRERWPQTTFTVRYNGAAETVTVSWVDGPTQEQVRELASTHCRHCAPRGGVLWVSAHGTVFLVEPRAAVLLRRSPGENQSPRTGDNSLEPPER